MLKELKDFESTMFPECKEVQCVMNKLNIFNEKETYTSYTCNTCPGKPDNICYLCFENCHKNHNNNTKNVNEKKLEIRNAPCSCALKGHSVAKQELKMGQIRTDTQELQCTLNEVLHCSNSQYYYMDPTTHMYYCLYCLDYCLGIFSADIEDPLSGYIKREKSKFAQSAPLCSCSNKDSHCPFYENINSLVSLIKTKAFDRFINRVQIPGQILSKTSLIERYLEPIKTTHAEIAKNYKENNISKYQKEQLPKIYINSLNLFKTFSEAFGKDVHLMTNPNVQNYYNLDFLFLIFSRTDDLMLIETKINALNFFRKFYLLPLIKNKRWHFVYTDFENVSPLHRSIFRPHINDFFSLVKIDKNIFSRLINKVHSSILKYNNDKLDEKNLSSLIIEYFKYLIMLISFKFTPNFNMNDRMSNISSQSFYSDLIDKFVQIVDLVYVKKGFENLIKKYLEIFVIKVILTKNDDIFFEKVFGRFMEGRNFENRVGLYNNISNRSIVPNELSLSFLNTSRHLLSNLSNRRSFHELNEEEEPTDEEHVINNNLTLNDNLNHNTQKTFCFQKGEIEIKIIKSLFAFAKEETDKSNEIKHWEIYDMLMHPNDYYKETVDNLNQSELIKQGILSEDGLRFLLNTVELDKLFPEEDIKCLSLIKEDISILEENKIRYYDSNINENVLLNICMKTFPNILKNLENLKFWGGDIQYMQNNTIDQKRLSIYKQIYLVKSGCLDILLNIWVVFNSNGYIKDTMEKEKRRNLNKNILDILKCITVNNSFLISLFFNPSLMDIFFSAHCAGDINRGVNCLHLNHQTLNPSELAKNFDPVNDLNIKDFYLFLLKGMKKQNYKFHSVNFVNYTLTDLDYILHVSHLYSDPERKDFLNIINIILNSFVICLKKSTEKSTYKINNSIATVIKNILSPEESGLDIGNLFYEKLEEFKENAKKINKEVKDFLLLIYKNVNYLEDHYFILMTDYLNIADIEDVLTMVKDVDPVSRMVFTRVCSKYHVECPFRIIKNMKKEKFDNINKCIDLNVIGRLGDLVEEEESIIGSVDLTKSRRTGQGTSQGVSERPSKTQSKNASMINHQLMVFQKGKIENKKIEPHPLKGINLLISNMEKYRLVTSKFIDIFHGNAKLFINYFKEVILFPCVFTIYKILYFSPRITAKFKYLNYKCVYLFLECLKFFLSMSISDGNRLLYTEESQKYFEKFFNLNLDKNIQSKSQDLREFLIKMAEEVSNDLGMFNLSSFEPLKLELVIEKWMNNMKKFNVIDFLLGDKNKNKYDNVMSSQSEGQMKNSEQKLEELIHGFISEYREKKENLDDNVLIELFSNSSEDDLRSKAVKKTITLDLIFRLDTQVDPLTKPVGENKSPNPNQINTFENPSINTSHLNKYNENNMILLDIINRLFKADPDFWQSMITLGSSTTKRQLFALIRDQLIYLSQFLFIDFNKLSRWSNIKKKSKQTSANNFNIILEFLRLHCENHNKMYQTFLTNIYIRYKEIDLIDFILKLPTVCLINLEYYKNKKDIIQYFKPSKTTYFYDLLKSTTNYLIEIIQGSYANNFKKISTSAEFIYYYETAYRFFDCVDSEEEYEIYLSEFMRFLTCYFEENSNPTEYKLTIIKKFNPQKMLQVLMHAFKKLYFKYAKGVNVDQVNNGSHNSYMELSVPRTASGEMINLFLTNENISKDGLFILCAEIFKYFKTAILWKTGEKVEKLLDSLKKLNELKIIPEKNKVVTILKREVYKFFNTVIKEVEVFYKFKDNMEEMELNKFRDFFDEDFYDFEKIRADSKIELQGIQKVVYLVHPDSLFLKQSDIDKFNENAPFENFNLKLTYILNYYTTLIDTVQMRKILWMSNSKFLNFFFTLNYQKALYFSILLSVIVNILVLVSTSYNKNNNTFSIESYDNKNSLVPVSLPEDKTVQSYWGSHLNIGNSVYIEYNDLIFSASVFHLFYLFIIILNFMSFSLYSMQKFVNVRENFSFSEKLSNALSLLTKREIAPLVWNFLMGAVAILNGKNEFVYSLQLFAIFNLVPTMQSVIYSVRVRYKQFLSAGLLISIMILFYSSISFYLFREEFYDDDLKENLCSSFLHCFLTLMTNGIRGGAGLGFKMQSIHSNKYFSEFIFGWIFYFSIMLIMINVINGIIVDTFQALREQNNLKEDIQENVCYICSINRSKFEIRGVNFYHHKFVEHNILNYFYYILKVRLTNEQDLNSLDYQVLNYIKDLRTDFFPVKKALSLGNVTSK